MICVYQTSGINVFSGKIRIPNPVKYLKFETIDTNCNIKIPNSVTHLTILRCFPTNFVIPNSVSHWMFDMIGLPEDLATIKHIIPKSIIKLYVPRTVKCSDINLARTIRYTSVSELCIDDE